MEAEAVKDGKGRQAAAARPGRALPSQAALFSPARFVILTAHLNKSRASSPVRAPHGEMRAGSIQ